MLKVDEKNRIYLTRGDSATLKLSVTDSEGADYDFSGDEVKFSMKRYVSDANPVVQKTFDENGQITFTPEDTAELGFGDYLYDVQLSHTDESTGTVYVDTIIIPTTFTVGAEISD